LKSILESIKEIISVYSKKWRMLFENINFANLKKKVMKVGV